MNSGIYCINNIVNGKCYIGSAVDLYTRQANHFSMLKFNKHHSIYLQNAYNKYGEEKFVFETLEIVFEPELLIQREQWWLDTLQPDYNILKNAGSSYGYKYSEESKNKMSLAKKGKCVSNQCLKRAISVNQKPVIQIDQNTGQIINIWDSAKKAGDVLNIKNTSITRTCKGRGLSAGGYRWEYK